MHLKGVKGLSIIICTTLVQDMDSEGGRAGRE